MGINNAIICLRAWLIDLGAEGFSLLSDCWRILILRRRENGMAALLSRLRWVSWGDAGSGHRPTVSFLVGPEARVKAIPSHHEGQEKCDLIPMKLPRVLGDPQADV